MKKIVQLVILVAIGMTVAETSKILLMPVSLGSHINMFTMLGRSLKKDGHEVWVLAHDQFEEDIKRRELLPLTFPVKIEDDVFARMEKIASEDPKGDGFMEKIYADPWWIASFGRICDTIMQNGHIMTTILKQKFDLIVADGAEAILCHLMIPYRFDIPFVTIHGFQLTSWVAGVTGLPSIEPEFTNGFTNRMDFWQRLDNLNAWLQRYNSMFHAMYSRHMNEYCPPGKPRIPIQKLAEMSEMYFVTFEVMCFDYPRVSAPNLQYIGAASMRPAKPLPEDLELYTAGAEHGIVVVSFGSVKAASLTLWSILGDKLFEAFARLPQRVIAQYRLDNMNGKLPNNVKLEKWLPQNDLLANRKVKLFITHGGNNGQHEAAYHGVPMLVIPANEGEYIDHIYNGRRLEAHSYGKLVTDKKTVTSDELYQLMTEIMNNKTFSQNIKKCSEIIQSMPSPQEKFVFWVNHILKFGGAHLRPPSLDMPLYQVLMLDIVAYYVICCLIIFHVSIFILYFLLKYLSRKMSSKFKVE